MQSRDTKLEHARSFGGVADVYEASRPGYPPEAVTWLVQPEQSHVVDVGAGTGKLTRALAAGDREVVAVDPSTQMLEVLRSTVPGVQTLVGSGERMPLPDESVDAVTYAQAWHWVDAQAASAEAGRVLKPGGTLGLIWNFRDERIDWVRQLGIAMHADGDQYTTGMDADPHVHAPFGEPETASFEWAQPFSRDGLIDLVRSRSYFAVMTVPQKERTLHAVRELLDKHPQLLGSETIELPYVTLAFRYVRP
ncbi:class I SAM-dependent methyltransferase [Humibacter ginsengiterrae]